MRAIPLPVKGLYVFLLLGLLLCLNNTWLGYSFWVDELFSVTTAELPLAEQWRAMLNDVHPPLYQIILKCWILLVGNSEPGVRLLSLLLTLAALARLMQWSTKLNPWAQWTAIAIFSTSFLFAFYAQEARSYALNLCLATLLTISFIDYDGISRRQLTKIVALAFLLSLSHYFGLLLAGAVLFVLLFSAKKNIQNTVTIIIGGLLCLIWPLIHLANGLRDHPSWIVVDGPLGTLRIFFAAILPLETSTLILCSAAVMAALTTLVLFKSVRSPSLAHSAPRALMKLALVLAVMLAFVISLDLMNPISTERNFIVLLPVIAMMVGCITELLIRHGQSRWWLLICVVLVGGWSAVNLTRSYTLMTLKWGPQQNWKATAQYAITNASDNKKIYYFRNSDSEEIERVFNFYIKKLSDNKLSAERLYVSQIPTVPRPAMLIFGHTNQNDVNAIIRESHLKPENVYYPPQSLGSTSGVISFP